MTSVRCWPLRAPSCFNKEQPLRSGESPGVVGRGDLVRPRGDCLEVLFDCKAGYFRERDNDAVMEKVDPDGNLLGFSILRVRSLSAAHPVSVNLKKRIA
jgi:hypothetical protein